MLGIYGRNSCRVALHRVLAHFIKLFVQAINLLVKAPTDIEVAVLPYLGAREKRVELQSLDHLTLLGVYHRDFLGFLTVPASVQYYQLTCVGNCLIGKPSYLYLLACWGNLPTIG